MKSRNIICLILFFGTICVSCFTIKGTQNKNQKICVLGSVHVASCSINPDSIYAALVLFKPDIILIEADTSVFNLDYTFKKVYDENEPLGILKYKSKHPHVLIRPIELEGRNIRRKEIGIFSEAGPVFGRIAALYKSGVLSDDEQRIWNTFLTNFNKTKEVSKLNLHNINNKTIDTLVDHLMVYQYERIKIIVDNNVDFENSKTKNALGDSISLREYYGRWSNFEHVIRNEGMYQNIKTQVHKYPGKRIIVVTGFKHRSFFLKKLRADNFDVVEYYE